MQDNAFLIVVAGGRRFAVEQRRVHGLDRSDPHAMSLAAVFHLPDTADDALALRVRTATGAQSFRVRHADLVPPLPRFDLPGWIDPIHPAIRGVVLHQDELLPLIDLSHLALQTGYEHP